MVTMVKFQLLPCSSEVGVRTCDKKKFPVAWNQRPSIFVVSNISGAMVGGIMSV